MATPVRFQFVMMNERAKWHGADEFCRFGGFFFMFWGF
jgi:hypothetical protein